MVGDIDSEGIIYSWTTNVLNKVANNKATVIVSKFLRIFMMF